MSGARGLYLHWPYCARICPYCDFNVHRARGADAGAMVAALETDLRAQIAWSGMRGAETLFFGGGTPSLMAPEDVARLIAAAKLADGAEITLEANPEDHARFADFAAAGINRFSLGVQALRADALAALGRAHTPEIARGAVEAAAGAGARVSIDLIYAREGQGLAEWRAELREALALPIEHLSLYQLTIEEGTAFARAVGRGRLHPPPSEEAAALYEATQDVCADAGFPAYEISNHARGEAARSRHNLIYWRGGEWLGIGPGAHGRIAVDGERLATQALRAPRDYLAAIAEGDLVWLARASLTDEETRDEALLMGLRIDEGVSRAALAAHPPDERVIRDLVADGFLIATPERLVLTRAGRLVADHLAARLAV